jgi:ketosteroid isomerase-like protein
MSKADPRGEVTIAFLEAFGDAWNRHDLDAIMEGFDADCTFITGWGARLEGRERVRRGVEEFFARFPDARWSDASHFVCGDRGVSEWGFTARAADGRRLEMVGCDIFTFRNGRIAVKDAFRKDRLA